MMMNPNILNKNPLMFFDRAVNAQRSQLLTVMADAVSECRTAADQAAELNETGQVGLLRLAEVWSAIRAKEGMGGLVLEGTEAKILSDVVAQFYAYLSGCMFNDPVGMAIYGMERVSMVLSNTVQLQDWDGRYSRRNKEWAKTIPNDNPETVRCGYALNSHPAVLNGFIDLVREEQQRSRTQREKLEPSRPSVRDKLKQELPAHKSAAPKKREPER